MNALFLSVDLVFSLGGMDITDFEMRFAEEDQEDKPYITTTLGSQKGFDVESVEAEQIIELMQEGYNIKAKAIYYGYNGHNGHNRLIQKVVDVTEGLKENQIVTLAKIKDMSL